jgi:hypothetical protein
MRVFVVSLVVVAVLYFWDQDYNQVKLFYGLESMLRDISHSVFHR